MERRDFLLEIGVEELPVSYVRPALERLSSGIARLLEEMKLDHGSIHTYATPRRLALHIEALLLAQEDRVEEITGPPVAAAYRDGEPTAAATGFARSNGLTLDDLYQVETKKGAYLALRKETPGRGAAEILAEDLPARIPALRFPKTMTWGDGSLRFARPIRWLVALLGDEVVSFELGSLRSGRESRGHRSLHDQPVSIPAADRYVDILGQAQVLADCDERKDMIANLAASAAAELGGSLVADDELLETVSFLVEKPAALVGRFDPVFLDLPREVIVTALKSHQRYFCAEDDSGRLLPGFVVILNGERRHPDSVREGNERVLQARLEDARFYWEEDKRCGLDGLAKKLESVVWMDGFGTLADRSRRIERLALSLLKLWPGNQTDEQALAWAARYCKADLSSEMVKDGKEFTRLQGYMGMEYARAADAEPVAAMAIGEHYYPRTATDRLPESGEGILLALADRLDAMVGQWAAGFAPTGSKDPYAIRRQALAVIRIQLDKQLPFCLSDIIDLALSGYDNLSREEIHPALLAFVLGRLEGVCEEEGIAPDIFEAVRATGETRPLDLHSRAAALNSLRGVDDFEKLVIGARRVGNILSAEKLSAQAADAWRVMEAWREGNPDFGYQASLGVEAPEQALDRAVTGLLDRLIQLAVDRKYEEAYRCLAELGPDIDAFFDGVMVLSDDSALRSNRLAFLRNLDHIFLHFASFTAVVLEGERE